MMTCILWRKCIDEEMTGDPMVMTEEAMWKWYIKYK